MSPFDNFACEQELVEDYSLNTQSVKLRKTWKVLEGHDVFLLYYGMKWKVMLE